MTSCRRNVIVKWRQSVNKQREKSDGISLQKMLCVIKEFQRWNKESFVNNDNVFQNDGLASVMVKMREIRPRFSMI